MIPMIKNSKRRPLIVGNSHMISGIFLNQKLLEALGRTWIAETRSNVGRNVLAKGHKEGLLRPIGVFGVGEVFCRGGSYQPYDRTFDD